MGGEGNTQCWEGRGLIGVAKPVPREHQIWDLLLAPGGHRHRAVVTMCLSLGAALLPLGMWCGIASTLRSPFSVPGPLCGAEGKPRREPAAAISRAAAISSAGALPSSSSSSEHGTCPRGSCPAASVAILRQRRGCRASGVCAR